MCHIRLPRNTSLDDNILDARPKLFKHLPFHRPRAPFLQVHLFQHRAHRPLMPHIVLLRILIIHELLRVLVDGVVRQVHLQVGQIRPHGALIGLRGKPGEPLLENVDSQRINPGNEGVNPQVELQAVDQVWLRQVALHHVVFTGFEPVAVAREENATALARVFGLNNECFRLLIVEL